MFCSTFRHLKPHWKYLLACLTSKYACSFRAGTKPLSPKPLSQVPMLLVPNVLHSGENRSTSIWEGKEQRGRNKKNWAQAKVGRTSIPLTQHINLEEKLPGGRSSQKRTQLPTKRTDTRKKSAYCVPGIGRQWGWGICQQGALLHSKVRGKKVSTHDCKVNSRKQPGVWRQQSVCKGLRNEWVGGNERFKTFGSRLMKWREKGPRRSSKKWGLMFFFFFQKMIPSHHVTAQFRTFDFLFTTPESPK